MSRHRYLCLDRCLAWLPAALLSALLLCAGAGGALGQVAAPDLVPIAPRIVGAESRGINTLNVVPDNPAAMVWGEGTVIGVGGGSGKERDNRAPTETDQRSRFAGLRLHGGHVALGAEALEIKRVASGGFSPLEERDQNLGVAIRMAGYLALGVSARRNTVASDGLDRETLSSTTGGLALNFADWLYLGYGIGQNEIEMLQPLPAVTAESETVYTGIAVSVGEEWRWYLAYDVIDESDRRVQGVDLPGTGLTRTTTTLQTAYAGWLLGVADTAFDFPEGAILPPEVEQLGVDLGYAPREGLTITLHLQRLKLRNTAPGPEEDARLELRSVALAWRF